MSGFNTSLARCILIGPPGDGMHRQHSVQASFEVRMLLFTRLAINQATSSGKLDRTFNALSCEGWRPLFRHPVAGCLQSSRPEIVNGDVPAILESRAASRSEASHHLFLIFIKRVECMKKFFLRLSSYLQA